MAEDSAIKKKRHKAGQISREQWGRQHSQPESYWHLCHPDCRGCVLLFVKWQLPFNIIKPIMCVERVHRWPSTRFCLEYALGEMRVSHFTAITLSNAQQDKLLDNRFVMAVPKN